MAQYDIKIAGEVLYNEPMKRHTSLKVGGEADIFAVPENINDLQILVAQLKAADIPWMAVGRGYNLLVREGGIRGCVISLEKFKAIENLGGGRFKVDSGVENLVFVRYAQSLGYGGISFISGIPGTLGGGIRMNAGAYGGALFNHVECVTIMVGESIAQYCRNELDYGYRSLRLESGSIIINATFLLDEYDSAKIDEEIENDALLRRSKHNVGFPSAGSFFKNPKDMAAWKLIDAANLRGRRVGGATVSEVHSNFLVNSGGATADDFIALAELIKNEVYAISGVTLEEEVRIVGEI